MVLLFIYSMYVFYVGLFCLIYTFVLLLIFVLLSLVYIT